MLSYEMTLKGFYVGYIHPHYYFDAKSIHNIIFYARHQQWETEDKDGTYYKALKELIEDDNVIHIRFKRYRWLPRFINDWREGELVKSYICSRFNEDWPNRWYTILPDKTLEGERARSLFIWLYEDREVVYKMTECKNTKGVEEMTFEITNKY